MNALLSLWGGALALTALMSLTGCDDDGSPPGGDASAAGDADTDADGDAEGDGDADYSDHPTVQWVLACQNDDGGFGSFPGDISNLTATAFAVEILESLDITVPHVARVGAFIREQQNDDGGFHGRQWGWRNDVSTLTATNAAVRALTTLGLDVPRPDAIGRFVASRQRGDGGFLFDFPSFLEDAATCEQTWQAVDILHRLERDVPREGGVLWFLRTMQDHEIRGNGSFMREHIPPWMEPLEEPPDRPELFAAPPPTDTQAIPRSAGLTTSTAFALAALRLLGEPPSDAEAGLRFLERQQNPSGGFFTGVGQFGAYHEPSEGRTADLYAALWGARTIIAPENGGASWSATDDWLTFLASGAIDDEAALDWLARCQNPDGGFARSPDPISHPSDMDATWHAVQASLRLGRRVPAPTGATGPVMEVLPPEARFDIISPSFTPGNAGQALYLWRIIAPIREASVTDEATAREIMGWLNRHLVFGANTRNESAQIVVDGFANCGGQSFALMGLLQAAGIEARFLSVDGHNSTEALLGGRWSLLDPMFDGAFERPSGGLYSALDVHENHRSGGSTDITTFGDWRYEELTIYWPDGTELWSEVEIWIGPDDGPDSEAARRAYP